MNRTFKNELEAGRSRDPVCIILVVLFATSLVQNDRSGFADGVLRLFVFQKAMILWTMDPAERDANLLHGAIRLRGDGGENDHVFVLVEISCASAPDHLVAVRRAYASLFGCSLEEDLASSVSFQEPLKKLLVGLVTSYRYDGDQVDEATAAAEAALLCEAVRRKKQPHGEDVVRVISTRSKAQLAATFGLYRAHHGTELVEDIESRCSSQFAGALKSAVWCLTSPEKHFAEVI